MSSKEKDEAMSAFAQGQYDVLGFMDLPDRAGEGDRRRRVFPDRARSNVLLRGMRGYLLDDGRGRRLAHDSRKNRGLRRGRAEQRKKLKVMVGFYVCVDDSGAGLHKAEIHPHAHDSRLDGLKGRLVAVYSNGVEILVHSSMVGA